MQSQEETRLDQQAPEEASAAVADAAPKKRGRPPGSKNAKKKVAGKKVGKKKASKKKVSKKKASKKKAGKKKASKKVLAERGSKKVTRKKASKKKASKKKASKKKRGKKKVAAQTVSASGSMARLMAAVEELREAVVDLAQSKAAEQQSAVSDLRKAAQSKIADIEEAAVRSLKKFGL